jgi:hypothetical protein
MCSRASGETGSPGGSGCAGSGIAGSGIAGSVVGNSRGGSFGAGFFTIKAVAHFGHLNFVPDSATRSSSSFSLDLHFGHNTTILPAPVPEVYVPKAHDRLCRAVNNLHQTGRKHKDKCSLRISMMPEFGVSFHKKDSSTTFPQSVHSENAGESKGCG